MARPAVDLLRIAARVAASPSRDEFMRELALRMTELDRSIHRLQKDIVTVHEMEGKIPLCQWRQILESLVMSLKGCKRAHHECELLLRRCAEEPHNKDILKLPIP